MRFNLKVLIIIILCTGKAPEVLANWHSKVTQPVIKEENSQVPERRRIRRIRGKRQIKDLKDGLLLVRLKTSDKRIAAFEKKGEMIKAEMVRKMQRDENLEILYAFNKCYNYSKVYFFYSNDSEKIKEGNWDGVFLNDSLQYDPSISPVKTSKWFIGELDYLESDTAKHWERSYFNPNTKRLENIYWGTSPEFYRRSLVIRDNNFIQLKRPFPYYVSVKTQNSADPAILAFNTSLKRSIPETVNTFDRKLKRKLMRFYNIRIPYILL